MTQEELKQKLKDKLIECDRDKLVDIITDLYLIYIGASALIDMSSVNCMQQPISNVQTDIHIQEINNFIAQKLNTKK